MGRTTNNQRFAAWTRKGETLDAASMRVSRYIYAAHMPSGATLANLAEALSVTVDWLLANHGRRGRRAG